MDFTFQTYTILLKSLIKADYSFQTVHQSITTSLPKIVSLRHDIDKLPINSLQFARIQAENGIKGSYYFRIAPESFNQKIIKEISSLGHEIGYHYEDVSIVAERQKTKVKRQKRKGSVSTAYEAKSMEEELARIAIESYNENLEKLSNIAPVKTICMHGSPMSRWDSRLLWKYYDYSDLGIDGEPYFDINFDNMLYLTDTGRRWNGQTVSVRDKGLGVRYKGSGDESYKEWKVKPILGSLMNMTTKSIDFQNKYKFRTTSEIIRAAERRELPDKIMMTFHPQRWTDKTVPWVSELVWQNIKNVGKYFFIKMRKQ
jgi:hypothetical protein